MYFASILYTLKNSNYVIQDNDSFEFDKVKKNLIKF